MPIRLRVNGKPETFGGDADMPLLWFLRDYLHLTGTKYGCGAGLCGACTVHVDGAALRSCSTPMSAVDGHSVTTIEGLADDALHRLQVAWIEDSVPQCGYCQPGQIMQAAALIQRYVGGTISDEDIDQGMFGNICRCGTYTRIRTAIRKAVQEGS
ncbi:MAG: (2Fe-2S)-binding protein [Dehalococcoidia bacterium]